MRDPFDEEIAKADRLRDAGALEAALAEYQRLTLEDPGQAIAKYKQGTVWTQLGRPAEAEQSYRDALAIDDLYSEALNNLAILLVARGEWDEAEQCYRRALAERPDYFEAHVGLARLLRSAWRHLEALYFARRASQINPRSGQAHELVGFALKRLNRIHDGIAALRLATELQPELALPWQSLAGCLQSMGRHAEADSLFSRAMAVMGNDPTPASNYAFAATFPDIPRESAWARHQAFGEWARKTVGPLSSPAINSRPPPERRLKIGFISGDMRRHSVAYFLRGALECLSRQEFQLYAYFDAHREDQVSAWLKPMFHHWRDIFSVTHDKVFDTLREDGIDILFDLSGHTGSNRMLLFARRPAPVQVSYIGYPDTTGLDTIDYRITDGDADPPGDGDEYHSEKLWRLPRCFLCYAPPEGSPEPTNIRPAATDAIVFGSFNNRAKISDRCFEAWVAILQRIPDARLVIKSINGLEDDDSREGLRKRFTGQGITEDRLDIRRFDDDLEGHLRRYGDIDIALDTFPYNGTTTTCEALWMGVPVISLRGDRHAARVSGSLLACIGLDDLVAGSVEEYIAVAIALASDRSRLQALRAGMRTRLLASPLLDRQSMGAALGDALRSMWHTYCAGFDPSLPLEDDHTVAEQLLRLHIGGRTAREGWKILDIEAREEVDFVADVRDLSAFAAGSCRQIYAAHVLDHLQVHEILPVLNEFYRLLIPGGLLYLSVYDLDTLCSLFVNPEFSKPEKFAIMRTIFGAQDDSADMHRIGLNFDFLIDYLKDVGFSSAEHVESLGIFDDASDAHIAGQPISLNLIITR